MQRLTDQVAIVTGGAQGVGRGIASVLAAEGARVVIADVDGALAESTAAAFRTDGRETFAVTADVTDRASVEAMAARVVAEHGRIDILAANAGVYPSASIDAIDEALWDRVMDINVKGAVRAIQACTPTMVARGVRPNRSDVLDHGARDRPGRFRALRRLEGGHARLHALCGCRARDQRRHDQRSPPRERRDPGLRRHERRAPTTNAARNPDGPLRGLLKTSAGPSASSPPLRPGTSRVRH